MSFSQSATAKINLFLHVGDRRADGFHPLQSLAVFTDLGDRLTVEASSALSLRIEGPFAAGLDGEGDNLVLRAAKALQARCAISAGTAIVLAKNLPVASGIGGGSADAAAALRLLRTLWGLTLDDTALLEIAASIGSDVPVCLESVPTFMEGRGEILHPVTSLPQLSLLLVNPGNLLPTKDVFAALESRSGVAAALPTAGFDDTADLLRFLETTRNDLEAPARVLQPMIAEVLVALAALPGALLARMSGSGATCFALFPDDECCRRAGEILSQARPGWWIAPTFVPRTGIAQEVTGQDIGPTETGL